MASRLETIKNNSPEIPSDTCPYIDFIQSILDEIKADSDSHFVEKKIETANSLLEYVRDSNEFLRKSSRYWYNQFSKLKK